MQIQIASDLHLEFRPQSEIDEILKKLRTGHNCGTIILAGDICSHSKIWETLKQFNKLYSTVIFVNGNHECWGTSFRNIKDKASWSKDASIENSLPYNIYWLYNSKVYLENKEFLGTTLWFPKKPANEYLGRGWPDKHRIVEGFEGIYRENATAQAFLKENVTKDSVVITHHLPCEKSIHKQYEDDPYNNFFVCNMEELIIEKKPKLYIHGHTHHKFDYMFHDTRIISNPLGYSGEIGIDEFDWNKIIEI